MLLLASRLDEYPVMSLQTGGEVAKLDEPIIDPGTLEIVAYTVRAPLLPADKTHFLRVIDVRELSDMGMIIDSIEEIVEYGDVIKIDELYDLGFPLVGMRVRDEKRTKIGKIVDYTIDVTSFSAIQLTVRRPLLHSLTDTELVIHRSQIIEITDDAVIVHSKAEVPEHTRVTAPGAYVNPFRKPKTAGPENSRQAPRSSRDEAH